MQMVYSSGAMRNAQFRLRIDHRLRGREMKLADYLLTFLIGIMLTVHLAMNGKVGAALDNARVGNAVFWCVGAVAAVIIGITGWNRGALAGLRTVEPILLVAGAIGACLVFGIAFLIPRIGAAKLTLIMLAGQILAGLVVSHFGWLGSPKEPVSARSLLGAVIMFGGVILATL
jgi:bacterial/archaeal transporter family-2 protein